MSAVCRFAPQNHTQQLRNFFFVMSFWPPWPGFSVKSDEPQFEPPLTPVANRWVGGAEPARNRSVVLPSAEARTICARRTTLCGAECERLIRSNSSPSLSLMQRTRSCGRPIPAISVLPEENEDAHPLPDDVKLFAGQDTSLSAESISLTLSVSEV